VRRVRGWAVVTLAVLGTAGVASAQVTSADRTCIATFNKAVRTVGKAQGKIAAKCLQRFAYGACWEAGFGVTQSRPNDATGFSGKMQVP
jgi:hypothetical protein